MRAERYHPTKNPIKPLIACSFRSISQTRPNLNLSTNTTCSREFSADTNFLLVFLPFPSFSRRCQLSCAVVCPACLPTRLSHLAPNLATIGFVGLELCPLLATFRILLLQLPSSPEPRFEPDQRSCLPLRLPCRQQTKASLNTFGGEEISIKAKKQKPRSKKGKGNKKSRSRKWEANLAK